MGKRLRFLGVPLLALLWVAALSFGAWASISIVSQTDFVREGSVPNNDNWNVNCDPHGQICEMPQANDITITLGTADDHLIAGAFIEVRLPEGLEFCAEQNQQVGGGPACGVVDADGNGIADVLQTIQTVCNGDLDGDNVADNGDLDGDNAADLDCANIRPIWQEYRRDDGQVVRALVGFRIPILDDDNNQGSFSFQFNGNAGANAADLTIRPIRSIDRRPLNECYKMTVTVNAGSSDAVSAEVGRICMLRTPQLTKAELVGNDLYVHFDVPIDPTSITQGNVNVGTGVNSEFQMDLDNDGVWNDNNCNVTVEIENNQTVVFRNAAACNGLDTAGNDLLRVNNAAFIRNALAQWPNAAGFQDDVPVPILAEGVGVYNVQVSKTRVGVNVADNPPNQDFDGTSRADDTNVLQVTIESSGFAPIYVRLVPSVAVFPVQLLTFDNDDCNWNDNNNNGQFDAGECTDVNDDSVIVNDPNNILTAIDWNLNDRDRVIIVPANNNNGLVRLDFAFDDTINDFFNAVDCMAGKECTIKLQVSTSPRFVDVKEVEVVIDQKAPSIILAGDERAKALSRTQIQFAFNEEMDRTSVERLFVDNGNGGGQANDGVRNGNEPWIYCVEDLNDNNNQMCEIPVTGVTLASDGRTVTLTTQLLPVGHNFRIWVLGAGAPGGPDATNREGVMDLAGNYIAQAGNYRASNQFQAPGESLTTVSAVNNFTRAKVVAARGGALMVTVTGPANLEHVFVRAVAADDPTVIVSQNPAFEVPEVSPGVYRTSQDQSLALIDGITASEIKVLASTDQTFTTGVIESDPIPVDPERPTVTSATYVDENHVKVCFSEQMFATDLADEVNYTIPGLQVVDAEVDLNTVQCVTLTTTTQTPGVTYVVDVAAVHDLAGNTVNTAADTIGVDRAQWTAGVEPLSAEPTSLTLAVGETATINISGGVPPYSISASGGVTVEPETLDAAGSVTVTAVTTPGGTVTIRDSSDPVNPAQVEVSITVTEAAPSECSAENLSACTTEAECVAAGGYWCDGVCQATECETGQAENPPTGEGQVGMVENPAEDAHMPYADGQVDVNFNYTSPVYIFAGMLSCDFNTIYWLDPVGCTFTTQMPAGLLEKHQAVTCEGVDLPLEAGYVFYMVVNADDLTNYDWQSNYLLNFYAVGSCE